MTTNEILTPGDREALRGFLQRCEVRLSTLHRTATALLSGAGVLVLLPTLGRDAIVQVIRRLLRSERTSSTLLILAGVALVIFSIIIVIWLLLAELTRFYFHSNHLGDESRPTFTTRFSLASLRLATDELTEAGQDELSVARTKPEIIEQLFAANQRVRQRIDSRAMAYPGLSAPTDDSERADLLSSLAGARDRTLVGEVAKTEFTMVRLGLQIQVIVLRYMKALLTVILSLLVMFGLTSASENAQIFEPSSIKWTAILLQVWAVATLAAVSSPIGWITSSLRNDGANRSGIRYDRDLVRLERILAIVTSGVVALATAAGLIEVARDESLSVNGWFMIVMGCAVIGHVLALRHSRRA